MIRTDSQGFVVLQSIDSTNNYAMAQVHAGMAKHGQVYFALEQTAGRGQRGKHWETGTGENIAMSIVFELQRFPHLTAFVLSAFIANSCRVFISKLIQGNARIKWPNDIYIGDRKAGGILIENQLMGNEWLSAVAGIGLNINRTEFPLHILNPVSLKNITGVDYDPVKLGRELSASILDKLETAVSREVIEEYNDQLYKRGETVTFRKDNVVFQAKIIRVTELGRLVVFRGIEQELEWGEVEWIFPEA